MTIILRNNIYSVQFPYDPMLVQMLKSTIPCAGRKWDNNSRTWLVDTQYEAKLRHLFPNERVPAATQAQIKLETRIIDLRYLGQVKDRGNGELTAFGFCSREWSVIIPEAVLKYWFEGIETAPVGDVSTYYGVLGVPRSATGDEIKTGYRRMARQWHPDVCREPNANVMFLRIREAYDVLSNIKSKSRYDVGLTVEAQQPAAIPLSDVATYRAPLRCGYVLAEGQEILGRFSVSKILGWEDIVNQHGQTLVSSWIMGDSVPIESWV